MRMRATRTPDRLDETGTAAAVETSSEEEPARPSLVSLLAEAGLASELELRRTAAEADAQGIELGELVVARGLLDEEALARLVARQWGLPFLPRGSLTIDPAAAGLLPLEQARPLGGCVIGIRERSPLAVVADPSSERLDALRAHLDTTPARPPASFAVVTPSSLNGLLGQLRRINPGRTDPDSAPLAKTAQPTAANPRAESTPQPALTDQLLAELQQAAATEQALQARLDRLERDRTAAEQQVEQLKQQLAAADQQRAGERDHDSELQARLDQLDSERETANRQIEDLQERLEATDQQRVSERETADQQIEQLQQQLAAADQQRASERDHDSELQTRLDQLEHDRTAAEQQLEQLQQQLAAADQQRVSERETADQQIEQLQQQLAEADQQRASERDHDSELQARLDQLEHDRTAAEQQLEQLQQQLAAADQQRVSERETADQQIERLQQQLEAADRKRRDLELKRQIHELLTRPDGPSPATNGEMAGEVSRINVRLLEGVFSPDERRQLAKGLIKAVVGVKGESFRNETEVLIAEVPVGNRHERGTTITREGVDERR